MQKNNNIFLISIILLFVLIIIINVTQSVSKFGDGDVFNIMIASSDIVGTTFTLQQYAKCYIGGGGILICDPTTYSVTTPPQTNNPIPVDYQNNLEGYYNYLTSNVINNANINVFHCNFKNTLNDYQGQIVKEDYFTGLGNINCTQSNCAQGYDECSNISVNVTPGTIQQQPVTLQNKDLLIITLDRYVDYGLYNRPTVYQYIDDGDKTPSDCPTSIGDCGTGNIINNTSCGGCNLNLVVNAIVPDVELPLLRVYNGITLSTGTDFIDNKGNSCYLIPNLFINNVTITIPNAWNGTYKEFMTKVRAFIGQNSYVSRIDAIPGSINKSPLIIIYYTTLDNNYNYQSDSYVVINAQNFSLLGHSFTITNVNNRLTDLYLNINFHCVDGACGINDRAEFAIITPLFDISDLAGNGNDYNFLKALLYTDAIQYNTIDFGIKATAQSTYDSPSIGTEMTVALLNELKIIQCNSSIKPCNAEWYCAWVCVCSQIECWFYKDDGSVLWSGSACRDCDY
jgi:hypothetical protein